MGDAEIHALVVRRECGAAVALLYNAHERDVARYVRSVMAGHENIAEVCQDVWAAVTASLPNCRFEAPLKIWVLSIARRKVFDVWRRHVSYSTLDSAIANGGPLGGLLGLHTETTPSRALSRRERSDAVRRSLSTLDDDERELLLLRYVNDLRPAEIAALLPGRLSPNTISQRIVRAARRLRRQLEAEEALG